MREVGSPVHVVLEHLIDRRFLFFGVGVRETVRYRLFTVEAVRPEAGSRVDDVRCPTCEAELLLVVDSVASVRARRRARLLTALVAASVAVLAVVVSMGSEYLAEPILLSTPLGAALLLGFLLGGLVAGVAGYLWWRCDGVRLSAGVGETDRVHTVRGLSWGRGLA